MKYKIHDLEGKVFYHPKNKQYYGSIRVSEDTNTTLTRLFQVYDSFAQDDCGNIFYISKKGKILFWDHETDKYTCLSNNFDEFIKNCDYLESTKVSDADVLTAWVDPDFAKEIGIEVPDDGKIK